MISHRMIEIAKMVKTGMAVADIGTDHAFLPIYLVENGISPHVYACDVREGPLAIARRNIASAGLSGKIDTILCDGFEKVPADAEIAVIAGMGFYTARKIIEDAAEKIQGFKEIIVEVNRDVVQLRQWISEKKYTVTQEKYIFDKGHDYIAIAFCTDLSAPLSEEEIITGTALLEKSDPLYQAYCCRQIEKIKKILSVCQQEDERIPGLNHRLGLWQKQIKT
ncbi:MAG: SAM-dependent methyltransferase [Solobacterium sp.]|nr:SAM-dependent methyltransferase [Solobacterium sp.]